MLPRARTTLTAAMTGARGRGRGTGRGGGRKSASPDTPRSPRSPSHVSDASAEPGSAFARQREEFAQLQQEIGPPAGASDAYARLERESLREASGAFARLEREALHMKEVEPETELSSLRKNMRQLHVDARAHVLLEREERSEVTRLRSQVAELQQAFHSLANLLVEEVEGVKAEQVKQREELDSLWRSHRDVATLKQELAGLARAHAVRAETDASVRVLFESEASRDRSQRELRRELDELRMQAARDRDAMEAVMRLAQRPRSAAEV